MNLYLNLKKYLIPKGKYLAKKKPHGRDNKVSHRRTDGQTDVKRRVARQNVALLMQIISRGSLTGPMRGNKAGVRHCAPPFAPRTADFATVNPGRAAELRTSVSYVAC